jgi:hypothetical protein
MAEKGIQTGPSVGGEHEAGPGERCGTRLVRLPIAPPTADQPAAQGGRDRLIAAIAAVIRDAMAADAAVGLEPPLSGEGDED